MGGTRRVGSQAIESRRLDIRHRNKTMAGPLGSYAHVPTFLAVVVMVSSAMETQDVNPFTARPENYGRGQ